MQRGDESHRSPHPDRWETGGGVPAGIFECVVGDGDSQRQRWHVAQHVEQQHPEEDGGTCYQGQAKECRGAAQMHNAVELFGVDPFVCYHTHDRRRDDRGDAHRGKRRPEVGARPMFVVEPVGAERQQPCSPHEELEEVHDYEAGS
ncbi:Uncharacterised protein [Mycobacteroides abscessus subsp. massiliense]|nr:Uncharacterised protein [Mycobacteroides abscessus subsp. massiliense]